MYNHQNMGKSRYQLLLIFENFQSDSNAAIQKPLRQGMYIFGINWAIYNHQSVSSNILENRGLLPILFRHKNQARSTG